ncbi:tripartite tricarboxylate transporter TctB family protein [Billgrantia pellis]|uniref:Tripartite tricarboxylate transporter TctB family protein n=1 Tax=Billgrantia pellis TaxID=2606936 RepID=A0A7V7G212_9GAMM|nr:tripartite tricarboxylate transporter TctB family protein [Halomonas pellis]KAA0013870.1 tripartite tricarboxylate transporter TctB family protein [Halomonas pellis]
MSTHNSLKGQGASSAFPLLLCSVSIIYLISAMLLDSPISNGRPSASFFPLVVGSVSLALAVTLLVRALSASSEVHQTNNLSRARFRPILVMVATLAYILAFTTLGYFLASVLYVLAIILLFSDFSRLLGKIMIAVSLTLLGYLLFEQIFRVRLPTLWG